MPLNKMLWGLTFSLPRRRVSIRRNVYHPLWEATFFRYRISVLISKSRWLKSWLIKENNLSNFSPRLNNQVTSISLFFGKEKVDLLFKCMRWWRIKRVAIPHWKRKEREATREGKTFPRQKYYKLISVTKDCDFNLTMNFLLVIYFSSFVQFISI